LSGPDLLEFRPMKILGIDYGRKKIGVAISDVVTGLVEPIGTAGNFKFLILNFKSIFNDPMIKKIVVGIPDGKMDVEIKEFGARLKKETGLPVEFFDETLTTHDAQRLLIASGRKRKLRKEKEDAVAAAIMLQYYLEGRDNDD